MSEMILLKLTFPILWLISFSCGGVDFSWSFITICWQHIMFLTHGFDWEM